MVRSDQMRARALHDAARLREALALIATMAEGTHSALTLPDIARIARAALVGAEPADPRLSLDPEAVKH